MTGGLTPGRIPWGPTLLGYLHDHFRMAGDTGGIVVWARAPLSHYVGLVRESFLAGYPFELDVFQLEAMDALDRGHNVVVAAPTGSGKTVVAEYAVARAIDEGAKAFYTTPLKALSNQKFADFTRRYGSAKVGLLTGDNSVNGDAPIVVMTTEVLRNMIYAGSSTLAGLRYVVLDEVHYLQDPYRGPVWEEVIIHLPPEVDLVCLSATVSNAEELADWVGTVRGSTTAVIEERRPVPLHNLFLVGERRSERLLLLPTFVDERPNPRGIALTSNVEAGWRAHRQSGLFAPRRSETVDLLGEEGLLPAIYFIFSRAGCDEAVRQCMREGGRLTTTQERRQIRDIAEAAASNLSDADLAALGYGNWLAGLEAGFAAHHAGLVPPFKEAVERCFLAGLVRVVFATETLSLGINMPARSVVIEKLSKFGGERVEPLTPGEYTQLTGRAGRRGTDEVGYAVALWSPGVTFDQVASLAGARSYTLTSSFRPTYNMATNLVRRTTPAQAHHLLNLSFAQYRADSDVVRLESSLERARQELAVATKEATLRARRRDRVQAAHRTGLRRPSPRAPPQRPPLGDRCGDGGLAPGRRPAGAGPQAWRGADERKGGRPFYEPAEKGRPELAGHHRQPPADLARRQRTSSPPRSSWPAWNCHALRPQEPRFPTPGCVVAGGGRTRAPLGPANRSGTARADGRPRAWPWPPAPISGTTYGPTPGPSAWPARSSAWSARSRAGPDSLARQFDKVLQLLERWGYVRGVVPDAGGCPPRSHLPPPGPPRRRVRRAGDPGRPGPRRAGGGRLGVHLRGAWPAGGGGRGPQAPQPAVGRTLAPYRGCITRAERRRGGSRAAPHEAARLGFRGPGPRLGEGQGPGHAAGRRPTRLSGPARLPSPPAISSAT